MLEDHLECRVLDPPCGRRQQVLPQRPAGILLLRRVRRELQEGGEPLAAGPGDLPVAPREASRAR
ncbi:hypothetical protein [Streptomyces acidicola]|uniref:Uncharacterized protein n=1 Tax=Streptomyces acidicola TaxID=2596892 RepID=A0A5N8X6F2_9ACTN|nr:hypothetical protein [Streptomyces acidicola]MPY55029.1 hypothetical protein [Streptomyces acidicola]